MKTIIASAIAGLLLTTTFAFADQAWGWNGSYATLPTEINAGVPTEVASTNDKSAFVRVAKDNKEEK